MKVSKYYGPVNRVIHKIAASIIKTANLIYGVSSTASSIISFKESLQKHRIALSKTALVDALRNIDPEVRWPAAASQALGHWSKVSAVLDIQKALIKETNQPTREQMH